MSGIDQDQIDEGIEELNYIAKGIQEHFGLQYMAWVDNSGGGCMSVCVINPHSIDEHQLLLGRYIGEDLCYQLDSDDGETICQGWKQDSADTLISDLMPEIMVLVDSAFGIVNAKGTESVPYEDNIKYMGFSLKFD
tara:strand:+ start:116 stop:523 length:408 start_codon:yes stop_codon:yes gene_type:complete